MEKWTISRSLGKLTDKRRLDEYKPVINGETFGIG